MKNLVLFLCFCILSSSCTSGSSKRITDKSSKEARKIDSILIDIFEKEYPNYETNTMVREKALSRMVSKIDSLVPLNYLSDIPLKVLTVRKNPHGEGAIAQFYTDNFRHSDTTLSNLLDFEIIGLMSEQLAQTIDEEKKYLLYGSNFNRLDNAAISVIVDYTYFSPEPEIQEDIIYSDVYRYKLGVFICEVDSLRLSTHGSR